LEKEKPKSFMERLGFWKGKETGSKDVDRVKGNKELQRQKSFSEKMKFWKKTSTKESKEKKKMSPLAETGTETGTEAGTEAGKAGTKTVKE